jgi:hypothetical protein
MSTPGGIDLLLFVAGEPGSADEPYWSFVRWLNGTRMAVRFQRWWLGERRSTAGGTGAARPLPTEPPPWHLPPQVTLCVNLVLENARRTGRTVTVVDVDRAGPEQDLVDRWVGPNDVLPLLVRPDGARLEGIEEFIPQKVREFIGGP